MTNIGSDTFLRGFNGKIIYLHILHLLKATYRTEKDEQTISLWDERKKNTCMWMGLSHKINEGQRVILILFLLFLFLLETECQENIKMKTEKLKFLTIMAKSQEHGEIAGYLYLYIIHNLHVLWPSEHIIAFQLYN